MEMPGKQSLTINYRFSINGQEKTPEIAPNTTTAEFWQYDARIGRRWNVDPISKVYESPYVTFADNPLWFQDPAGNDTTKYFSRTGTELMTIGNGKKGYFRAMIVNDEKLQTVKDYAAKYAGILNSGKAITNNQAVDNSLKNFGELYDIVAFRDYYNKNNKAWHPTTIKGFPIDKMKQIKVNGKPSTTGFLKNLPAEALFNVVKKDGIHTVGHGRKEGVEIDLVTSFPNSDLPFEANKTGHGHTHQNFGKQYKIEWGDGGFGYPSVNIKSEDGPSAADYSQTFDDIRLGSNPLRRNVVVDNNSVYLITGDKSKTIKINR
jgi:hypothetical protein